MSTLDTAIERRNEAKIRYFREYLKIGGTKSSLTAFGLADVADYLPPDQRLGIGVAFGSGTNGLGLALRASKRDGVAHRAARNIGEKAEKDGSWADVRVVENLSIPARTDVVPLKADGFPRGGDPLMLGVSVSHPKSPAGSLGGFVRFKGGGEGIISACHVLANSGRGVDVSTPEKAPMVYHPASADVSGRLGPRNQIGQLYDFRTLDTPSVELDVAVATLLPSRSHIGNQIPKIPGAKNAGKPILKPPSEKRIPVFKAVAKVGRSTGYTEGRLSAGFFDSVPLEVPGFGIVYYGRMFEIESTSDAKPFAAPGDSGAAVFDVATRSAFGLIVGGGEWDDSGKRRTLVYSCELAAALEAMDVTWL